MVDYFRYFLSPRAMIFQKSTQQLKFTLCVVFSTWCVVRKTGMGHFWWTTNTVGNSSIRWSKIKIPGGKETTATTTVAVVAVNLEPRKTASGFLLLRMAMNWQTTLVRSRDQKIGLGADWATSECCRTSRSYCWHIIGQMNGISRPDHTITLSDHPIPIIRSRDHPSQHSEKLGKN